LPSKNAQRKSRCSLLKMCFRSDRNPMIQQSPDGCCGVIQWPRRDTES
jgi:hypothetical protein